MGLASVHSCVMSESLPLINNTDEPEDGHVHQDHQKQGIFFCITQMCLAICGSGTLSIPFAFSRGGLLLSMIALFIAGMISVMSVVLLLRVDRPPAYKGLASLAFGSFGQRALELLISAAVFLNMISYCVIMFNVVFMLICMFAPISRFPFLPYVITAAFALVLIPIAIPRHLRLVRYVLAFTLLSLCVLLAVMFYEVILEWDGTVPHLWPEPSPFSIFVSTSIFVNALIFQFNLEGVLEELHNPTPARKLLVGIAPIVFAFCVYCAVGVCGLLAYKDSVQGNVLMNLHASKIATCAALASYLLVTIGNWRMMFDALSANVASFSTVIVSEKPMSIWFRVVMAILTATVALGIAMSGIDLSLILSVIGSTFDVSFAALLPGVFYLLLAQKNGGRNTALSLYAFIVSIMAVALIGFGLYGSIVFRNVDVRNCTQL